MSPESERDDDFGTTTVIPHDALPFNNTAMRVQVGSVLRDRFLLQAEVSGGSMGTVYKALDRRLAEAGSSQRLIDRQHQRLLAAADDVYQARSLHDKYQSDHGGSSRQLENVRRQSTRRLAVP